MPIVSCPQCGHGISDRARTCVNCGSPLTPAPTPPEPVASPELAPPAASVTVVQSDLPFFSVPTHKFAVMCIVTLGLYQYYWLFLQWRRLARMAMGPISPFWRTFFAPLWAFSFCSRVRNRALVEGTSPNWSAGALAAAYLVLSIAWRLPDPWSLIPLLSFLPLLPVQQSIERINARHAAGPLPNRAYTTANRIGIVVGSLLLFLAVVGSLLPH